jgi:hypothetical protein
MAPDLPARSGSMGEWRKQRIVATLAGLNI